MPSCALPPPWHPISLAAGLGGASPASHDAELQLRLSPAEPLPQSWHKGAGRSMAVGGRCWHGYHSTRPPTLPPKSCSCLSTDLLRGSGGAQLPAAAIQGARLAGSASPQLHWHLGLQRSSHPPAPPRPLPPALGTAPRSPPSQARPLAARPTMTPVPHHATSPSTIPVCPTPRGTPRASVSPPRAMPPRVRHPPP